MSTELTTKVRLVRCPKCQKLLPELPEFNLYKCGGCGTTLQAKRGVKDDRSRASILSDMDADKINQPVHASEEKESTSPSNKDTLSDSGECSLHENNWRDQHTSSGDSDADEQLSGTISSRKDKDQDNGGDQKNNFSDCKTQRPEVTNEACSSTEFAHDKIEEIADNQNDIYPNEKVETTHNGNGEFSHGMIEDSLPFGGRCLKEAENDENAPSSDINTTEINEKLDSDFRSSSAVNLVATVANGPNASADHKPVKESISTDVVVSSPGEQLLQTQSVNHDSVHVKTAEAWISTEFDPSSKLSDAVKNMNKSPTTDLLVSSPIQQLGQNQSLIHGSSHMKTVETRESSELEISAELIGAVKNMIKSPTTRSALAYDGSVSSFDEMDDNLFQDAYKVTHSIHSEEKPRRDKFLVKSSMSTDSEMQRQQQNSWSEKRNYVMNKSKWDPDEYLQSTRQGRVSPNWSGSERDEYDPRRASHPLGTRPHYEYGGPSNQLHDTFHRHSSYQSSDWPEDSEQDKMKLMRMIFELQDQVNKTLFLQGNGTNGVPGLSRKVSHNPRYHNNQAFGEEVFPPLNYSGHLGRCRVGSSCSEQRRYTQMPFSGETSRSHQLNSSYLHCCPQDRPFSAQLPPYVPRKNDKLYKIHPGPGQSYYTSFSSCPSSPQQSLDSELPHWGHETKFNDRRWKSQEMRNYSLVKRHFRPLAGAAPFITCYNCFHLLHLPADFLLFKRKIHRLRCGACSEVLKFSLQNQYHIVPYTLRAIDPPENLVDDYNEAADRRILASSSEANNYSHADPGSYSDDYDQSHYKSCSTEGDPASFTPSHNLQGSLDDRKVQYSSFGPAKDIFSRQPQNNYRQPVLRYQSAGTSSGAQRLVKLSSEIGDLQQRSSSPLHRLLGYSSPTDLLYVSRPGQETTAQSAETRLKAVKDD